MYGLSIASVLAVLLTLAASLTRAAGDALALRPRGSCGRARAPRGPRRRRRRAGTAAGGDGARRGAPSRSRWRRWSVIVQARPWPLAIVSLAVMVALLTPVLRAAARHQRRRQRPGQHEHAARLRPARAGLRRRASTARCCSSPSCPGAGRVGGAAARCAPRSRATPRRRRRHRSRGSSPSGTVAVMRGLPATRRRRRRRRPTSSTTCATTCCRRSSDAPATTVLVGGFTAGSIDFSNVLVGQAAAVHRDRRRALGAAAARDVPLARDRDAGGGDEPAEHRRRARRDRRRLPVGLARRPARRRRRGRSSRGYRC